MAGIRLASGSTTIVLIERANRRINRLAKDIAGAHREQPPEKFPGRNARQNQRIDVALVIGTEKIGAALGKFLECR